MIKYIAIRRLGSRIRHFDSLIKARFSRDARAFLTAAYRIISLDAFGSYNRTGIGPLVAGNEDSITRGE